MAQICREAIPMGQSPDLSGQVVPCFKEPIPVFLSVEKIRPVIPVVFVFINYLSAMFFKFASSQAPPDCIGISSTYNFQCASLLKAECH